MKNILNKLTYSIILTLVMISCNKQSETSVAYWGIGDQVVLYNKNYKSDTSMWNNLNNLYKYPCCSYDSNITITNYLNDTFLNYSIISLQSRGPEKNLVEQWLSRNIAINNTLLSYIYFSRSTSDPVIYPIGKIFLAITYRADDNKKRFDPSTINNLDIAEQEKDFLKQYATINPPKQFRVYIKTNFPQKPNSESIAILQPKQYVVDTLDILYDFNGGTVNPYPLISRKSQYWGAILAYRFNNQRFLEPPYGQIPEEN
ncbi:MAG: hypothetical protein ORN58_00910, partial [Sediminibacterium sp.]|nr:hypothetical protein [Sediminibacterium sp.]